MKTIIPALKIPFLLSLLLLLSCAQNTINPELARLEARAQKVTIIRDDFGIPHIYAKTDADEGGYAVAEEKLYAADLQVGKDGAAGEKVDGLSQNGPRTDKEKLIVDSSIGKRPKGQHD